MFLDEARLLGALHHQYIAPVYEVGIDERGRYFLVMDYVRGETAEAAWKAAVAAQAAAPLGFALTVVSAVASALDYAHALRAGDGTPLEIVHRDVSLSNIMIGHDGAVKLIDFGIAKFAMRTSHTQIGSLKGKLSYLSPEQILGKSVDRRADIFALGIVLYELTTLARAFDGEAELITLEKITSGDLALPSQIVKEYPRELERIVMKALAIDPALRYQDAGAMGRDLEAFAARTGLMIGHATVVAGMQALFAPAAAGGRRRFARASSEVDTGRHAKPELDDLDVTPVTPVDLEDSTFPRSIHDAPTMAIQSHAALPTTAPMHAVSPPVHAHVPVPVPVPAPASANGSLLQPMPPVPAPLVVRIGTPFGRDRSTTTSKVMRRLPTASTERWWWPLVVFGVVVVIAIVIAVV
jgi:hypothetical protein